MGAERMLKAMLYETEREDGGRLVLRPVTSAVYLTVPQIADTLGVSKQTVYRAIEDGRLKAVRFGSTVRVEAEAYRRWIEEARLAEYERPRGGCGGLKR